MFVDKSMQKTVVTIIGDTGIIESRDIMSKHGIRHLPVVDENGKLTGIVTDRDIRSAMPSILSVECDIEKERERLRSVKAKDIMTKNPITISPTSTLQDALLVMESHRVGAFPVVDDKGILKGILSIRDLMRAFINVLGIGEPGVLMGLIAENKVGQMKKIVDAITEENISIGSVLVAKYWDEGKRAVFPYVLTNRVSGVKRKLEDLGFEPLDPMEWYLDRLPEK